MAASTDVLSRSDLLAHAPARPEQTATTAEPAGAAPHPSLQGRAFDRLGPREAASAQSMGALLVDIRRGEVRRREGEIPGALVVSGPLREWRLGPDSAVRICAVGDQLPVIVVCANGQSSVLVASALQGLGVRHVADVVGGFAAWAEAGLPVCPGGTLVGRFVQ